MSVQQAGIRTAQQFQPARVNTNSDSARLNRNAETPQASATQGQISAHLRLLDNASRDQQQSSNLHTIVQGFEQQFATVADDVDAFHALMQQSFGSSYDQQAAEAIRQQTLAGDFSWMPAIQIVAPSALADTSGTQSSGVGLAAYDSTNNAIYLSSDLVSGDTDTAVALLTEEVGHALDAQLNQSDSAGDEGELFARLVAGEQLSAQDISDLRAENDHGTIVVDGEEVSVEYGWFSDAWDSVTDTVGDAWDSVTDTASNAWDSVTSTASNAWDSVTSTASNAWDFVTDTASSAWDSVSDTVSSAWNGVTSVVNTGVDLLSDGINWAGNTVSDLINSGADLITDGIDLVNDHIVTPALNFIPGGAWVNDHIVQPVFGLADDAVNFGASIFDSGVDFVTHSLDGAVNIAGNLAVGNWSGAWESVVETSTNLFNDTVGGVVEAGLIAAHGLSSAVNDVFNLSETRGLTAEEIAYLETIYGSSVDYDEIVIQQGGLEAFVGIDPHALGNDIYLPDGSFNADGTLTEAGLELLSHEVGHVWQFQNDGGNYISEAIFSYIDDRPAAYDYASAIDQLLPWDDQTPDQQAEFARIIGIAIADNPEGELTIEGLNEAIQDDEPGQPDLTPEQFEYIENIQQNLLDGDV